MRSPPPADGAAVLSAKRPDPFSQPRQVALYQDLSNGWTRVSTYWGKDDSTAHAGDVRISEPVAVTFKPLSSTEAIDNAVASLDAKEKQILADTEMALRRIREQKQSLLAITHQAGAK